MSSSILSVSRHCRLPPPSTETLDELTEIVAREYSGIPNSNRQRPDFPSSPISHKQAATQVFYRTVKDTPQLRIEFPLPDLKSKWALQVSLHDRRSHLICFVDHQGPQPGQYISHFAGHESPGSILADLKDRGWATSLSSSCSNGAAGFEFLRININLTAIGLSELRPFNPSSLITDRIDSLYRELRIDSLHRLQIPRSPSLDSTSALVLGRIITTRSDCLALQGERSTSKHR